MFDEIFGYLLLAVAAVWLALATLRDFRAARRQDWEDHVTSAPGLERADDWDLWSEEIRGLA
jgi:hypothetical protein